MFSKLLDKALWVFEKVVIGLLAISLIIVMAQIFFRYVFNTPLNWSEQMVRSFFIWMTMLCVPMVLRKKSAIAFDLIVNNLPVKLRNIILLFVELLILLFAVYFFTYGLRLCIETGDRVMAGIRVPQNLINISAPVAMAMTALVSIEQLVLRVQMMKGAAEK